MMKISNKLAVIVMACLLCAALTAGACAVSVSVDTSTIYMPGDSPASIFITGIKSYEDITDIAVSDPDVIYGIGYGGSDKWQSLNSSGTDEEEEEECAVELAIYGKKKGSATVSFDIDGKTYKKKFKVVGYANPVKSFVLSGRSSKNLKSSFAKTNEASLKLSSKAKAGYLTVAAASGWKIMSVNLYEPGKFSNRGFESGKGVSSAKVWLPALKKNTEYAIDVDFMHKKTKATQSVRMELNPAG